MFSWTICWITWPASWTYIHASVWWATLLFNKQFHKIKGWRICNSLIVTCWIVIMIVAVCFWGSDGHLEHWKHDFWLFAFNHMFFHRWLVAGGCDFGHIQLISLKLLLLSLQNGFQVRHTRGFTYWWTIYMMIRARCHGVVVVSRRISKTLKNNCTAWEFIIISLWNVKLPLHLHALVALLELTPSRKACRLRHVCIVRLVIQNVV